MKTEIKPSCRPCQFSFWIGLSIILLMLTLLTYKLTLDYLRGDVADIPPYNPEAALGEVGARCGGEMRLPCKPGNACLITEQKTQEGVCALVNQNPGPMQPPAYTPDIPEY